MSQIDSPGPSAALAVDTTPRMPPDAEFTVR